MLTKNAWRKQSAPQKLTSIFVVLLLSVFVLSIPPGGYSAIIEFKSGLFLAICGGYVFLMIVGYAELLITGRVKLPRLSRTLRGVSPVMALMLAYLVLTVFSGVISRYDGVVVGSVRREGMLTICIYVFSFLLVSKYFIPQRWMLSLLGVSVILFCALCVIQFVGANPFYLYPKGYNYYDSGIYYSGQYLGTVGNTCFGAAFLCLCSGVFAMSIVCLESKRKWVLSIPHALAVFTIIEMNIEAGMVGLAGGILIILPVAITKRERLSDTLIMLALVCAAAAMAMLLVFSRDTVSLGNAKLFAVVITVCAVLTALSMAVSKSGFLVGVSSGAYRKGAIACVGAVVLASLAFLWCYNGASAGIFYEASELLHGRWQDDFGTRRIYIWRNILENMRGSLLLGTGPDTVINWPIEPFQRYSDELGQMITARIDAAHNEYLNIAACQGILALASYLAALVLAALQWFKNPDNSFSAIAGAGVLFYCIQAFFGISMFFTAPLLWVCLAVLINENSGGRFDEIEKKNHRA